MNKKIIYLLIVLFIFEFGLASCKSEEEPVIEEPKPTYGTDVSMFEYSLYNQDKTIVIDNMKDKSVTSLELKSQYMIEDELYTLVSIGDHAFNDCILLKEIIIPDSIVSIGAYAFLGCDALEYTEYENGYYLGNNDNPYLVFATTKSSDVTNCTIHENCKIICEYAFSISEGLTNVSIPDGIIFIGSTAFKNCNSLRYNEYDNSYYLGNDL